MKTREDKMRGVVVQRCSVLWSSVNGVVQWSTVRGGACGTLSQLQSMAHCSTELSLINSPRTKSCATYKLIVHDVELEFVCLSG